MNSSCLGVTNRNVGCNELAKLAKPILITTGSNDNGYSAIDGVIKFQRELAGYNTCGTNLGRHNIELDM